MDIIYCRIDHVLHLAQATERLPYVHKLGRYTTPVQLQQHCRNQPLPHYMDVANVKKGEFSVWVVVIMLIATTHCLWGNTTFQTLKYWYHE